MRAVSRTIERVAQLGRPVARNAGRDQPLAVAHELVEPVIADRDTEILRGDVFELMRLVDDRIAAFGNHLAVRALADSRVGAEQVMIHDHQIRLGRARAHARDEAIRIARALGADAVFRCRRDFAPERQILWEVRHLCAIAGFGLPRPFFDDRAGTSADADSPNELGSVAALSARASRNDSKR